MFKTLAGLAVTVATVALATPAHAADSGVVTHAEYNTFRVWDTARTLTAKFGTTGTTFLRGPIVWRVYQTDEPGTELLVQFKRYAGHLHAQDSAWVTLPS